MSLIRFFIPIKFVLSAVIMTFVISAAAQAQEAAEESAEAGEPAVPVATSKSKAPSARKESWSVGISTNQWNERLRVLDGVTESKDVANFNGLALTIEKDFAYPRWGWGLGAFIGSGRSSGGGNSTTVVYQQSKVPYTFLGVQPRGYYRLSARVSTGITALVFMKNIDWPKENAQQTVDSGRNLNAMPLLDIKIRLFSKWDLYQGMGPLAEGSTLWKIGLNYRF